LAPDADSARIRTRLLRAYEEGRGRVAAEAEAAEATFGIEPALARRYLGEVMRFTFGPREWEGLSRFFELA